MAGVLGELEPARELLGMEVAYLSEWCGDREIYRAVAGDGRPFGIEEGAPCGELGFDATCVGAPVRLWDGTLFGKVVCLSRQPSYPLGWREAGLLEIVARSIGRQLEHARDSALERERLEATAVGALMAALSARDSYTSSHSDAVVDLALKVGWALGLDDGELTALGQVATLHDIGKIGVPDAILQKPGPLDESEWQVMRTHSELGARMVASVGGLTHLALAVRAEHERWDGGGYPDGLRREMIPKTSRIVFACDAYHAMRSDRPYRSARSADEALTEIEHGSGSQFCPDTVAALLPQLADESVLQPA